MATTEHVQIAASFGLFMLAAGGLGLVTGTTLGKTGFLCRADKPTEYYTTCACHLALGAFCYFGQFFAHVR